MADVRERLAVLCDQLSRWPEEAEKIIRDGGAWAVWDEIRGAGAGLSATPESLESALEAIEGAFARAGAPLPVNREAGYRPLPFGSSPDAMAWTCPRGQCDRVVLPEEARGQPVCAVTGGSPMQRYRGTG